MGRVGRLATVREFARRMLTRAGGGDVHLAEVRSEGAAGDISTAEVVAPAGIDSAPLAEDTAVLVPVPGLGREVAVAFADTREAGVSEPGEIRLYSRNAQGSPQAIVRLLADGSVSINAPKGVIIEATEGLSLAGDLSVTGTATVSGDVKLDAALDVGGDAKVGGEVSGSEVKAGAISLTAHTHEVTALNSPTGLPL